MSLPPRNHEQGRRQTYVYLYDLLYPLYAQLPTFLDSEQRHQYLVFSDDATLRRLVSWMNLLARTLDHRIAYYPAVDFLTTTPNVLPRWKGAKSDSSYE